MNLYEEFFGVVEAFQDKRIRYALIGGLSLAFHDRPRFTRDIDLLVHPADLADAAEALSAIGFRPSAPAWSFQNANLSLHRFLKPGEDDEMMVDVIVADEEHIDIIANAVQADSTVGPVPVAEKRDIIRLKQSRNSKQDQADIETLRNDED